MPCFLPATAAAKVEVQSEEVKIQPDSQWRPTKPMFKDLAITMISRSTAS